jgi:hypothetical protein
MGLLTLVLAHNVVFVVGYGAAYREALSRTGHGGAWTTAVVVVLALGLGLLLAAALRIAALTRRARALGSVPAGLPRGSASFPRPFQDAGRRPSSILGQRLAVRAPPLG